MMETKPIASLSLDLDNKWSYLKTRGDSAWQSLPSYLDILIPRVLRFLRERSLTITFFVVGQDAALPENKEILAAVASAGHEIGNHSFHHEPWLHLCSEARLRKEIEETEEKIERITGKRPAGFRGPGYSFSASVLKILLERGYTYDASTLPTFIGPVARLYYFLKAPLSSGDRRQRKLLFGTFKDGLRPLRQHRLVTGSRSLIEIPVTTMPVFRIPFHFSYLLYLSRFSGALSRAYFSAAVRLCRATGTEPSLLLHPLDFLGPEDTEGLSFFPAMDLPAGRKLELLSDVVEKLGKEFRVTTLMEHARHAGRCPSLPSIRMTVGTVSQ